MAAGVGSRINRSINKPKSTLDVGGTPLITKTVDMLLSKGVEVAVVIGYKHDEVIRALEGRNVKFYRNPFYRVTNSMASLWFAKEFITDDDIIFGNADVFWGEDVFNELISDPSEILMLSDESRVKLGDFFFKVENGLITGYGKELALNDRTTEYVGIAKIAKGAVNQFRDHLIELIELEKYDLWWENTLYEYLNEAPVHVKDISQLFWAEIDYFDDYLRILKYIETGDVSYKLGLEKT